MMSATTGSVQRLPAMQAIIDEVSWQLALTGVTGGLTMGRPPAGLRMSTYWRDDQWTPICHCIEVYDSLMPTLFCRPYTFQI